MDACNIFVVHMKFVFNIENVSAFRFLEDIVVFSSGSTEEKRNPKENRTGSCACPKDLKSRAASVLVYDTTPRKPVGSE